MLILFFTLYFVLSVQLDINEHIKQYGPDLVIAHGTTDNGRHYKEFNYFTGEEKERFSAYIYKGQSLAALLISIYQSTVSLFVVLCLLVFRKQLIAKERSFK